MDDKELWEAFKKTGRVADYLRYRGVDIYAATNAVTKEESQGANKPRAQASPHHRGTHHSGI